MICKCIYVSTACQTLTFLSVANENNFSPSLAKFSTLAVWYIQNVHSDAVCKTTDGRARHGHHGISSIYRVTEHQALELTDLSQSDKFDIIM